MVVFLFNSFLCLMLVLAVVPQLSTVLVQLLLWVHSLRRLLECLFVSVFSDGAMHLVQYMFGLGYYIMLGLTILCCDRMEKGLSWCFLCASMCTIPWFICFVVLMLPPFLLERSSLLSQLDWLLVAGFLLFIWASWLQHQSMVLLARLRTGKSGKPRKLSVFLFCFFISLFLSLFFLCCLQHYCYH